MRNAKTVASTLGRTCQWSSPPRRVNRYVNVVAGLALGVVGFFLAGGEMRPTPLGTGPISGCLR